MKKTILTLSLAVAICLLAGCTPKAESLWCSGLGEGASFSLEYSVSQNSFDGQSRSFTVKDKEAFESYLQSVEEYAGTYALADAEGEACLFLGGGNGYFCTEVDYRENAYKLTPCALMTEDENGTVIFAYPPTADSIVVLENNTFTTLRDWAYFSDFYSLIAGTETDDDLQTIVTDCYTNYGFKATGKVTLTFTEGTFVYSVSENE
ncbi:MAG: hypothetical protein ACI3XS_07280 [Eubacteriales bacterium]